MANFPLIQDGTRESTLPLRDTATAAGPFCFSGPSTTGSSDPDTRSSCSEGDGIMRRRHPWWALLATTALVLASLLAPMEGAAYRIAEGTGSAERGDPDNPSGTRSQPVNPKPNTTNAVAMTLQPLPGLIVRINVPTRLVPLMNSYRRSVR